MGREMTRIKRKPVTRIESGKVKKIMQQDDDIGKMAASVPVIVAKLTEIFMTGLLERTGLVMNDRGSKTLNQEHVAAVIRDDTRLDFLLPMVKGLRQIPQNDDVKRDSVKFDKFSKNNNKKRALMDSSTVDTDKKGKRSKNSQDSKERKDVPKPMKIESEFILTPIMKDSYSFKVDISKATVDLDEDYD